MYLDNLAIVVTQGKAALEELVNSNTKLIGQSEVSTNKFDQLSS